MRRDRERRRGVALRVVIMMSVFLAPFLSLSAQAVAAAGSAPLLEVIGDSYVANHRCPVEETWHYLLAQRHGFEYHNYGRNGSCIAFDRTHDGRFNFGPALWQRVSLLSPSADYVLIIAGHNDAEKIRHNSDSLRMFVDSLSVTLDLISRQCPSAKVGIVTPWYVDGEGFAEVCAALRAAADERGLPLLWNYSADSVIDIRDAAFRARYCQSPTDVAHLNAAGHLLFLPVADAWFSSSFLSAP